MELKKQLLHQIHLTVDAKINRINDSISQLEEARNNETKSSVGDKYETGRAMIQNELQKYQFQLADAANQKQAINQIDVSKKSDIIVLGSIVKTNKFNFFLSISIGKIEIDKNIYFAISPASPIGQLLLGQKKNTNFTINNNKQTILNIS